MSQELNLATQKRRTFQSQYDKLDTRRSTIFVADTNNDKRRENASIRRISILPTYTDETDGEYMYILKSYQTCIWLYLFSIDQTESRDMNNDMNKKRSRSAILDTVLEDSWDSRLKQFSYIDYRNCRCIEVIDCVFWKLHYHILRSGNVSHFP